MPGAFCFRIAGIARISASPPGFMGRAAVKGKEATGMGPVRKHGMGRVPMLR